MSTKKKTSLAAAATLSGGLVVGLTQAGSATATPDQAARASVKVASPAANQSAASAPLQLKPIVPAKSIVLSTPAATHAKPALGAPKKKVQRVKPVAPKTHKAVQPVVRKQVQQKPVSRAQVRTQLTHRAVAQTAQRHVAPQRHTLQRQAVQPKQVSRTQVRHAVTTPRTQPVHRSTITPKPATTTKTTSTARSATTHSSNSSAVSIAASLTGIPYVYSGSSMSGVDCSGYVQMVFQRMGINLPHQSEAIKAMTTPVSTPQPGDLVFEPGHVAIYAGNGKIYEAQHPGTVTGLYDLRPGSTFGRL